jgi:hypothetical protein
MFQVTRALSKCLNLQTAICGYGPRQVSLYMDCFNNYCESKVNRCETIRRMANACRRDIFKVKRIDAELNECSNYFRGRKF